MPLLQIPVDQRQSSCTQKKADEPNKATSIAAHHYWCYALHAVLFILQVILLAMLRNHPERNITLAFENNALTIGLSAFLQAFYTLYTAFLVFLTQRLVLVNFLSFPQKLTAIHDVSGAWTGLGAATSALWQQTNIAASTGTTLSVFVYLLCVSVLHMASPTVIEFEPYTAITTADIPATSTWPSASVNFTWLDISTAGSLLSLLFTLPGLSTDGLLNTTVYDTFNKTSQMIDAFVNAQTVRTNCGLLQNLSYATDGELSNVTVAMNDMDEITFLVNTESLLTNGVVFVSELLSDALVYMVPTAITLNSSMGQNVSLDIVWNLPGAGSEYPSISTTVYIVACSLGVSNYTSSLKVQSGNLELTVDRPDTPSQAWSLWAPPEDVLGSQLDNMVSSAYGSKCSGICSGNHTLDAYLMTLLGVSQSGSTTPNLTSFTLTPYQLENAISQMTAQLIWIAGQLSEEYEGFVPTERLARVTEQVSRWRLNINAIPVIFTLSASFILFVTAYLMLGLPSSAKKDSPSVKGTTVLEMLWVGAHFSSLRKHLKAIGHPSLKELRSAGMFQVWLAESVRAQESGTVNGEASPLLAEPGTSVEFEEAAHVQIQKTEDRQGVRWPLRALSFIKSRRFWCYLLHGLFVLLHAVLLLLLIRHPEHSVVIHSVSGMSTTALATSLQIFYVVYTLILVFLTQRLAVCRAVAHTQNLTSMHDLSQAWTGIGSALVGVWGQVKVAASLRTTLAITTYYLCVSALHIVSTTVIQFEVFDSNTNHIAQSALAWPASGLGAYDWAVLSPLVPLDQLPSLSTKGLANGTVYDVPTVDSASTNATVNASTIHANCGLLSASTDEWGVIQTTVLGIGPIAVDPPPDVWKDTVMFLTTQTLDNGSNISSTCSGCDNYLIYWVTTALDVSAALGEEVNVNTTWLYTPPGGNETFSNTTGYLVACSLNVTTTVDVLDVQNDLLASTPAQPTDALPRSWSLWSPVGSMPSLGNEISSALNNANPVLSLFETVVLTNMDIYTMSLFGINFTANNASSMTQSSANPSVTLGLSQFESAISQIAAQYIWAAGQTNGDFGPTYGSGESVVTDVIALLRLNVNTIPVAIASAASLVLFVLAVYMVGLGPLTRSPLSELGVLETLWLEAHSDVLRTRMGRIADPTLNNLRTAGMFKVCLADEVRGALDGRPDAMLELLYEGASGSGSSVRSRTFGV